MPDRTSENLIWGKLQSGEQVFIQEKHFTALRNKLMGLNE